MWKKEAENRSKQTSCNCWCLSKVGLRIVRLSVCLWVNGPTDIFTQLSVWAFFFFFFLEGECLNICVCAHLRGRGLNTDMLQNDRWKKKKNWSREGSVGLSAGDRCVCARVCEWVGERERGGRESERECVCLHMRLYMFLQCMTVIHSRLLKNVSPLNTELTVLLRCGAPCRESVI